MISVIVISLDKNIEHIQKELSKQTFQDFELVKVFGEKPASRARNKGAQKAKGDILIFVDDDMIFGSKSDLSNMISFIKNNGKSLGAVGSGLLIPKDANSFEKRLKKEIKRIEIIPSDKNIEAGDKLTGVFFGIKKDVYQKFNGLDNNLTSGSDREFFYRLKEAGYKNYFLKNTFVYHHPPQSLKALLKKYYWYGIGHFQASIKHPNWKIGPNLNNSFKLWLYFLARTLYFPIHVFLDTSFSEKKFRAGFFPLRALASYASLCGFIRAYYLKK